jgi:hypothetical protein
MASDERRLYRGLNIWARASEAGGHWEGSYVVTGSLARDAESAILQGHVVGTRFDTDAAAVNEAIAVARGAIDRLLAERT